MVVIVSDLGVTAGSLCVGGGGCMSIHLADRKQVYVVYNLNMYTECDYIGNSSVSNYLFPAQAIS
jgi:hypothetical protein